MVGCPFLGFGLGIRTQYHEHYREKKPDFVDWGEVITEDFLPWSTGEPVRTIKRLEKIRELMPVVLHGVSMSIGSADPIDKKYLNALKDLIKKVEPVWVSDHLCWSSYKKHSLHDLLPLPFTQEAIEHISEKILRIQDFLGRPILIENVSAYLEFNTSEMTEWEFICEILKKSGCGILLDVNNVFVSSINQNFNPIDYLRAIPKDRVGQIHLAGHSDLGHYKIDTHDEPICEEVWDLYRWAARHFGNVSAMIERDDNFPPWEELVSELKLVRHIWNDENGKKSIETSATL